MATTEVNVVEDQGRAAESAAIERAAQLRSVTPAVDIFESEDVYLIQADVPGARDAEVTLTIEGDELILHAPAWGVGRYDYAFGRRFQLPQGLDRGAIVARLEAGVLSIELPKSEHSRRRRVHVRSA